MPLHVAPHAKRLAAPRLRALERLLARVRVAVDPQRARPRERLATRLADVAVLALRERRRRRRRDVVVVLPWVGAGGRAQAEGDGHGGELLSYVRAVHRWNRITERYIPEGGAAGSRG